MSATTFNAAIHHAKPPAPKAAPAAQAGGKPLSFWQKALAFWVRPYRDVTDITLVM